MIKIYNTLTHKKEEFKPLEKGIVKMYACGITVSADAHIGHAIQAMIYDIVRKYLEKKGYKVLYARNYTDVDDKIIKKANDLGVDAREYAQKMMIETDEDMHNLGIDDATYTLKATEHINDIIEFVQQLICKKFAYADGEGSVYFSVEKFPEYGKLSNRSVEDALNGVRINNEETKANPLDFALWKAAKEGEVCWDSPWGKGRPGWHIECSAMNYACLGEQIDIHGGGRDLIFPHHENEIAQSEARTGKSFANVWMHNGLVKVNGQKMSKSLNNGITIKNILSKYHREVIKFALLQTNYKNDINIVDGLFEEAKKHMISFYKTFEEVEKLPNNKKFNKTIDDEFNADMDDDFNIAKTIANLFGYMKTMNVKLKNNDLSVVEDYNQIKETYGLLGLFKTNTKEFLQENDDIVDVPDHVKKLAEERWAARSNKDWAKSDKLRDEILSLGFVIKDGKGTYSIEAK